MNGIHTIIWSNYSLQMNLPKISIKDHLFSHAFSSSNWFKPSYFEWDFKETNGKCTIFTDKDVKSTITPYNIKKYAWLVESPVITPDAYDYVYQNYSNFDLIFTHSKKILERPNALLLPIGGCHLDENEISLDYEKNKLISMMYSFKRFSQGHDLRFKIAEKFGDLVDIMGSGNTGVHLKKINSCKDYAFSIVIENCKEDFYFTEKIIDCFLAGTIPIYWGCPSIGTFFDDGGFLRFDNIDELYDIIKSKDFLIDFYTKNMNKIPENFNKALQYKVAEDYMYIKYKNHLI